MSKTSKTPEEIIETSGHPFAKEVKNFLKKRLGWEVDEGHYTDFADSKNKEMDIIAVYYRDVPITGKASDFYHFNPYKIAIRLFIECKYIPENVVFRDSDVDKETIKNLIYENSRAIKRLTLKNHIFDKLLDSHHYFVSGGKRVFSNHSQDTTDFVYKAYTQALHPLIYFTNTNTFASGATSTHIIDYPVVITKRFTTFFDNQPLNIDNNFLYYIRNYNPPHGLHSYLIDFVSFEHIEQFVCEIEQEIEAIGKEFFNKSKRDSMQDKMNSTD